MDRKMIWLGMIVGSTAGSFLPSLWGDSAFSMTAVMTSAAGGFLGIWIGYRISR